MLRKLAIIGSIAALFVLTAAPAFGISMNNRDGTSRVVLDIGDGTAEDPSNPAHGPHCGAGDPDTVCEVGVSSPVPGHGAPGLIEARGDGGTDGPLPVNVGAWNAVFGPGGMSNDKTPICGIGVDPLPGLDDGTFGTNTCN